MAEKKIQEYLIILKDKGLTFPAIAKSTGIKESRLISLKTGGTKYPKPGEIEKIIEVYGSILGIESEVETSKRIEAVERDLIEVKERLARLEKMDAAISVIEEFVKNKKE